MISPWIAWSFTDLFSSRRYPRMTAKQQAAYINLLGEQATNGPLPLDEDELAFLACRHTADMTEDDWPSIWRPPLSLCFEERGGGLVNPRMADEIAAAEARSTKASNASRARWAKRKEPASNALASPEQSAGNARTGQDRRGQTGDTGAGGDTPPAAPPALSSLTEGERVYQLAVVECPRGRLARQGAQGAASWAFEWDSAGYPFEVGRRALRAYRASAGKPEQMPSSGSLIVLAGSILHDLMAEVMPLDQAIRDQEVSTDLLDRLFPDWQLTGWSPADHDHTWREAQAIARIVREERA